MRWRPYPIAIFDCDSTLSTVEGIDELATSTGSEAEVAQLTDAAMDGASPLEDVYGKRLDIVNPSRSQVRAIRDRYKSNVVPDAREVVAAIAAAGYDSWVVSGGLYEPVKEFSTWLGIDPLQVYAVPAEFDPLEGQWWNSSVPEAKYSTYERSELTTSTGKADIIRQHVRDNARRLLIGDGVSDMEASSEVDLFVAYAGVVQREAVVKNAPVVITSLSLSPLLALILGPGHVRELLSGAHAEVAHRCLDAVASNAIEFNDKKLGERFSQAFSSVM